MFKLINYINEDNNIELSSADKKMLSIIHNKVWKNYANNDRISYDVVEELRNLDEIFLLPLFGFLKDTMGFEDK